MAEPRGGDLAGGYGYDRWAPLYSTLERLVFGNALQRARREHLAALAAELPPRASVLLLGEGNGRALAALQAIAPGVRTTVVDASAAMLERIRRATAGPAPQLLHADLRDWCPDDRYHAVVGCFVLDLFAPATIAALVPRIAAALHPDGAWLHVDFHRPPARHPRWRRWRADAWLALLYAAFGRATTMEASALAAPTPAFEAAGLRLERQRILCGGLLESALWRRATLPEGTTEKLPRVN